MILTSIRHYYNSDSTGGVTLINGDKFCQLQEDTARVYGVKVPRETCIPAGHYQVGIRLSPSFKREMIVLYDYITPEGAYMVRNGAYPFSYIYSHGGNTAKDSEGCLLHGFQRDDRENISGTAEHDIFYQVKEAIKFRENVVWEIVNDPENVYQLADPELFG